IALVISVGQQAAEFSEETARINSRETVASCQRYDLRAMDVHEGLGHDDKATIRVAGLHRNHGFELGCVANRCGDRLYCERPSDGFEVAQEVIGRRRRFRVEQEGDPGGAWRKLLEHLQPFAGDRRLNVGVTGGVATWSRKARDEVAADWIGNVCENN